MPTPQKSATNHNFILKHNVGSIPHNNVEALMRYKILESEGK
ncbi:MAG: hypothetical protein ABI263_06565 [Gelidibacter sp.]